MPEGLAPVDMQPNAAFHSPGFGSSTCKQAGLRPCPNWATRGQPLSPAAELGASVSDLPAHEHLAGRPQAEQTIYALCKGTCYENQQAPGMRQPAGQSARRDDPAASAPN